MKRSTSFLFCLALALVFNSSFAGVDCITVPAGTHLLAGHLNLDTVSNGVVITLPIGTFQPTYGTYTKTAGGWPFRPSIQRGHGCIFRSNTNTVCFTNDLVPLLPLQLPAGVSLVCCQTNGPATFEDIVGRAPDPGTKVYRQRPGGLSLGGRLEDLNETNYFIYTFTDGGWQPEPPVADFAEAVWILQPPTISNVQISDGEFSFDTLTPMGASMATAEYTATPEATSSWLTLTNIPGSGNTVHVVDPADVNVVTQRFFRMNLHN